MRYMYRLPASLFQLGKGHTFKPDSCTSSRAFHEPDVKPILNFTLLGGHQTDSLELVSHDYRIQCLQGAFFKTCDHKFLMRLWEWLIMLMLLPDVYAWLTLNCHAFQVGLMPLIICKMNFALKGFTCSGIIRCEILRPAKFCPHSWGWSVWSAGKYYFNILRVSNYFFILPRTLFFIRRVESTHSCRDLQIECNLQAAIPSVKHDVIFALEKQGKAGQFRNMSTYVQLSRHICRNKCEGRL